MSTKNTAVGFIGVMFYAFLASLLFGQFGAIRITGTAFIYLHDILLAVFFLTVLLRRNFRISGSFYLARPVFWFGVACILSLATNAAALPIPQVLSGSLYLVRWLFYAGLYFYSAGGIIPKDRWIDGLYGVTVVFAAIGLVQYLLFPQLQPLVYIGWDPHFYRLVSTFMDPNYAGIFLVTGFFLGIRYMHRNRIFWIIQAGMLISVYLTFSRGSYLALLAGLAIYMATYGGKKIGILTAVLFLAVVVFMPKPGGDTLKLTRIVSSISRIENWKLSSGMISRAPLTGYGFNTLRSVQEKSGIFDSSGNGLVRSGAGLDSSVLFVLATTGIIGGAAFAWLLSATVHLMRNIYQLSNSDGSAMIAIGAAVFVHSWFSNSIFYAWMMIPLWIIIGAGERLLKNT